MQNKYKTTSFAAIIVAFTIASIALVNTDVSSQIETHEEYVSSIDGSMPNYSLDTLAKVAEYAIIGKVVKITPTVVETHTMPPAVYSDVLVEVERDLNDKYQDKTISVRIQGGEKDGVKTTADLNPKFAIGERVFFFVPEKDSASIWGDNYYVAGLYQGKYSLVDGKANRDIYEDSIHQTELFSKVQQIRGIQ